MKTKRQILRVIMTLLLISCAGSAHALSFALDSIAAWGKFPAFCIKTYRWGDGFFNGYNKEYVEGAGYKFNVKFRSDNWIDYYNFDLPNNMRMRMLSDPSTSIGAYLTYLAVSVGYDKNISKIFGSNDKAREQFSFGFNCSLFSCSLSYTNNEQETTINKFGPRGNTERVDLKFNGVKSHTFAVDVYYFFNHKKYSQAAAFSFSRIQRKSQGSWFAGFTYFKNKYTFDFESLPDYIKEAMPESWSEYNYIYQANNKNYNLKVGYGYNWVFARNWLLAISESPTVGIKKGTIVNPNKEKSTFSFSNLTRLSIVWTHGRWFAGLLGEMNLNLIYDKDSTFENAAISGNISVGYRFDIW